MNLAIRGIDFNLGKEHGDTFTQNQHPDLRADFILANPPFNVSDWWHGRLKGDPRWIYGTPPQGNANYAWLLFFNIHIPACLWFLAKQKTTRQGEALFIEARKLGSMISRVQAQLTDEVIERIAGIVAAWRS